MLYAFKIYTIKDNHYLNVKAHETNIKIVTVKAALWHISGKKPQCLQIYLFLKNRKINWTTLHSKISKREDQKKAVFLSNFKERRISKNTIIRWFSQCDTKFQHTFLKYLAAFFSVNRLSPLMRSKSSPPSIISITINRYALYKSNTKYK